jgi:tRNA G46 methylase TrmB
MAARHPGRFFAAVEGNQSVMLRAMEKVRDRGLTNVAFIPEFAEDLSDWFSDGEVTGIYLNFSDPLPKNYWYRRRLTYRERLKSYFRVLADEGTVTFKTDNTGLFDWSIQEIRAADLRILDITRDLHAAAAAIEDPMERSAFNIETEYEAKYSGFGEKIKRVVIGR